MRTIVCLVLFLSACTASPPTSERDAARLERDSDPAEATDAAPSVLDASSLDAALEQPDAGAAVEACPPAGPFGQRVGDTAEDVVLMDCDGVEHRLHDLCDRRAVWLFELAAWCPPCRAFAMSEANRVYDRFAASSDFEGWVVISENASFDPATRMDCEEIRARYDLHAPVLFDPEGRFQAAFGVPANEVHVVLGAGAEIRYVDQYAADEVEDRIAAVLTE